jgi:hypothetical protein
MHVQERTTDNKRRFRIEKLEERIAPSACCNPCGHHEPRHGCEGGSFSLKVDLDVQLRFGKCG